MLFTIISYRYSGLPAALQAALSALLGAAVFVAALALAVAVVLAMTPYLSQLVTAAGIVVGYALVTYPKVKGQL